MSLSQMATLSSVYIPLSFQSWNNNSFPLLNYNVKYIQHYCNNNILLNRVEICYSLYLLWHLL